MQYGVDICTLGELAEPARVVEMARAAEAAGWEAVFLWDHLAFAWGVPSADPWVLLAAVAQATSRVRLGPAVTPLPRRRPVVVAQAVATLDRLSGGRVVLGAGAGGVPAEFTAFGEPAEARVRAGMLDEALEVVSALWAGRQVSHEGEHYAVDGVTLAPLPVQRPRVPIWVGGDSRAAQRRAARWDGWIIGGDNEDGEMTRDPGGLAEDLARIRELRGPGHDTPFQVAMTGVSAGPDDGVFARYEAAGVTWWLEHLSGARGSYARLLSRIEAGPPGRA
ncbi:LLM class flavin-dependent oxidoreductase [Streptomyces litchfieldiae]|uniref:TIGR03619 family F420-dependent LLM class oxidoreductase n=1 Tax=Streptomyces litchfieldiae TaxID=3075543 RepID=A0ABU2MSJ1_9ACTN|nr:TIGR03619 family F420-dependent LLM class oxidoreductase [Streptomyces sp. DSM 44938]MDT0344490.1 TIGR03619 family F420-dependent LLM class oxidoreductase [Streptomyces sp. DSM 44938]